MVVLMNTGGIATTNCYLVADEVAKQAVVFDAPNDTVAPLLDEAQKRGWDVIGLWLTHGHFDHLADHTEVTSRFPSAKVLIHRLDEPKLLRPNSRVFALPFTIAPRRPDDYLAISDVFHKTFLNLDEKGIEAAAATALVVATKGIHEPPKPVEVRVDHPFLFAIVSQSSVGSPGNTCLFLGHVTDPR